MNVSIQNIGEKINLLLMNYKNMEKNKQKKRRSMQFLNPKTLLGKVFSYTKLFYFNFIIVIIIIVNDLSNLFTLLFRNSM